MNDVDRTSVQVRAAVVAVSPGRAIPVGHQREVEVLGVIVRDAQTCRVLADVVVHRTVDGSGRLETVAVLVIKVEGRRLVDDVAF